MDYDFLYFENKFEEIELKIKSKTKFINEIYRLNLERVDRKILVDQLLEVHESGLNHQRDQLLNEIISKRDEHLVEINEHFNQVIDIFDVESDWSKEDKILNSQVAEECSFLIQEKGNRIKSSFLCLNKCNFIDFSFNFYSYKFNQEIDLYKMDKYLKFLSLKKIKQLPGKDYKILNINKNYLKNMFFLSLPLDRIFLYAQLNLNTFRLLICDKSGQIIHSKEFHDLNEYFDHKFKIISTKIYILYEYANIVHVRVYDLKLNLVKSLTFSGTINQNLTAMENGLAYNKDLKLAVYDVNNFIAKETIRIQCESKQKPFFNHSKNDSLMFLDKDNFFFITKLNDQQYLMYEIKRDDGTYLKTSFYINANGLRLILFDNFSKCYCLYNCFDDIDLGYQVFVYGADGDNIFDIKWMPDLFCFNYKWSIMLNQNLNENSIEYEEYL